MQFFPAALSRGAQFSRQSGVFDLTQARSGQEFGDLFSAHLNAPQMPGEPPRAEQPLPQSPQAGTVADDAQPFLNHGEEVPPVSHPVDNPGASSRSDVAGRKEERPREGFAEPAKDAGQRQDAAQSEQDKSSRKVASREERPVSVSMNAAPDAEVSDESLVVEVRELLATLAAEGSARKVGPGAELVSSRIEALHELLRQFKDAPPKNRGELAVALGEQIKGLQRALAVEARAENAEGARGKRESAARVAASADQRLEALLQKRELRATAGREAVTVEERRVAARASSGSEAGVASKEQGARPRQGKGVAASMAAGQDSELGPSGGKSDGGAKTGGAAETSRSRGQEVAARPEPRGRQASEAPQGRREVSVAATQNLSGKESQRLVETADSALPADHPRRNVATEAESMRATAKSQEAPLRGEAATQTGIAAAVNRPGAAKDGSAQTMQQADHLRQDGPVGASEKARVADSKGQNNQPDARQGFFGEPDREKAAARAVQTVGGKNVPESGVQAAAQNIQPQFQQRVDSPVGARSAQVYQQVENGAFKNLGQGVKQLVIRLDPADLGQVSVILQVRGKEVQAVLRASNQDTTVVLNEQLGQLRSQLEAQGLKVAKLEVQTQLADSQSQSQWQGAESHNRYQENQELAMSAKRWRSLERAAPGLVRDVQISPHRENLSQNGLDIFA